jgi:choline transport protein
MIVKGGDVEQLITTPFAQPYVQIVSSHLIVQWKSTTNRILLQFYNVTQSTTASTILTALVFVLLMFGIINQVTTTSRQIWSFARDGGLPWSNFLSRVRPGV